MDIDAELRRQVAVSLLAAAVFVAGLVALGTTFGNGSEAGLSASGSLALVGLLAGFVLLMAGVGAYLIRVSDEE
ncbi:DUF7472 family protein [Haloparvum sedimenti]|uniref:DUF7472 family protein n=1 Tax=Haloparvum sedimenti TaxID=1678448 RepID=UPI00071E9D1D|nr:hypothetical protein [Haloparvum sedimenti]